MVSQFEFADDVVGILVKSDLDKKVFAEMKDRVLVKLDIFEKINLFLEVEKGHKVSKKALLKHLKFSLKHSNRFKKIAVVTEKDSLKRVVVIKDLLIDAEVEAFTHENRMQAIKWIAE